MTYIPKSQVQGRDPDNDAIDIEATASGNLKVVGASTTPVLSNIKQAEAYDFNTTAKKVTVIANDVNVVYSVYNETANKMVYLMNSEAYAGTVNDCCVFYTSTETMTDNDVLIVLYVQKIENATVTETNSYMLRNIVQELMKLNMMFSDAFGTDATNSDVDRDIM